MSQHTLMLEDCKRLVIGWDGPLATYFADVFDDTFDEDAKDISQFHVATYGMLAGDDIAEVDELRSKMAEDGYEIPGELAEQLEMDKIARGSWRTFTQQSGLDMIGMGD